MPAHEANPIYLSEGERRDLEALVRQQTCAQHVALRPRIVLLASEGVGIQPSATRLGIACTTVCNWRRRWLASTGNRVAEPSADAPRPGTPATYTPRMPARSSPWPARIRATAGGPITHWTQRELTAEAIKRGIVPTILQRSVERILKRCRPQTPSCARVAQRQARSAVRREVP